MDRNGDADVSLGDVAIWGVSGPRGLAAPRSWWETGSRWALPEGSTRPVIGWVAWARWAWSRGVPAPELAWGPDRGWALAEGSTPAEALWVSERIWPGWRRSVCAGFALGVATVVGADGEVSTAAIARWVSSWKWPLSRGCTTPVRRWVSRRHRASCRSWVSFITQPLDGRSTHREFPDRWLRASSAPARPCLPSP